MITVQLQNAQSILPELIPNIRLQSRDRRGDCRRKISAQFQYSMSTRYTLQQLQCHSHSVQLGQLGGNQDG